MSSIFESAHQVLAWFGADDEIAAFVAKPDEKVGVEDEVFRASPFFTRLWIQQELMLANW